MESDLAMAESAAQRSARLRAARRDAMSRANGGARESATVDETVTDSRSDNEYMANGKSVQDAIHTTHHNRAPKPLKPLTKGPNKPQQKQPGQSKVYTKHVLFALTIAFVMKLVANGKLGK